MHSVWKEKKQEETIRDVCETLSQFVAGVKRINLVY